MNKPETAANNPNLRGRLASDVVFSEGHRFAVWAVHTRFEAVMWFVADAERPDDNGHSTIVRQVASFEEAVKGLEALETWRCMECGLSGRHSH